MSLKKVSAVVPSLIISKSMADDDDWDLYAVVRSCKAVTTARVSTTSTTIANPALHHDDSDTAESSSMWDWLKRKNEVVETQIPEIDSFRVDFIGLEELYQLFFPSTTAIENAAVSTTVAAAADNYAPPACSIIPNSPTSFISDFVGGSSTSSGHHQLQQQQNNFLPANTNSPHFNPGFIPVRFPEHQPLTHPKLEKSEQPETAITPMLKPVGFGGPSMPTTMLHVPPHLIRPRKRKPPVKKMVCHLTAENLSYSDLWAWRKYGQKPIKGSPHPRNYYRCSSSKGCSARKQVERSNEDPNMFVVTYCGDHTHPRPTHRNSLAGSTRNKAALTTTTSNSKPESSSPPVHHDDGDKASEEAEEEEIEEDEVNDEEFDVSSSDDIFLGMKQLGRTGSGGSTLGSLAVGDNSRAGFSTKQSNLGTSWGAGCSSSAGPTLSGGC